MPADTQVAAIVFPVCFTADFRVVILDADPRRCALLVVCKHRLLPEGCD